MAALRSGLGPPNAAVTHHPVVRFVSSAGLLLAGLAALYPAWPKAHSQAPDVLERLSLRTLTANNTSASGRYRGERNGNEPPSNVSKVTTHSLLYPGATTQIFVRWMPWFQGTPGGGKHVDVGYNSDDPEQIRRQVEDMLSRGIDGVFVDWYGHEDKSKDRATERMLREAERRGGTFKVALSVDKRALKDCGDCTGKLIEQMNYAAAKYESSPAYLRWNSRPVVFFFGLETANLDWERVKREAAAHPLLFFRNSGAFRLPYGDGAYSWIAPESVKPGDPLGFQYLERFDQAARGSDKIVVASAYKGFDDSEASWGKHRQIPQQCGMTWLESFALINRFFNSSHQLPMLLIPTWNDYEEGTEIETGIDNCVRISAELAGTHLRWKLNGREETVDHFEVFRASATDPDDLTRVATLPPSRHEMDLQGLQVAAGDYALYVEAVGRPSLRNELSSPVRYTRSR